MNEKSMTKFYFASEGIDMDMGYKKYELNELQWKAESHGILQ